MPARTLPVMKGAPDPRNAPLPTPARSVAKADLVNMRQAQPVPEYRRRDIGEALIVPATTE